MKKSAEIETFAGFARELAAAAGAAILPLFRSELAVSDKGSGEFDPVTEADRAGEQAMRALIEAKYPDHGVIGEEFPPHNPLADRVWLLDPIDGTKSFLLGFPLWGTLIALLEEGRPVLGLLSQPFTREMFIGHGGKAWHEGAGGTRALKTRACAALGEAMLTTTSPALIADDADRARFAALEEQVRLSRYGGDCYGYAMLAAGRIDLVAETGLKAHDILPLIPIIEGAGGIVTDWRGEAITGSGSALAAGDARAHGKALTILSG